MGTAEIIIRICSGITLILVNALFVLTEFGLTRLRQYDKGLIENDPKLKRGWKMTEELEIYLTSCQLGISATSIILGVVFEPAITVLLEPVFTLFGFSPETSTSISIVVGLVIINLIHQVWGEQAPTYFGVEKPLKAVKLGANFLYWWTKILYPLILFGDWLSKATLRGFGVSMTRSWVDEETEAHSSDSDPTNEGARTHVRSAIADVLRNQSDLTDERAEEVINSFDIGDRSASDIMVPMDQLISLKTTDQFGEILAKIESGKHSRYPLLDQETNSYVGNIYLPSIVVNYQALEDDKITLRDIAAAPVVCTHDTVVSQLIDKFQESDQELCMLEEDGKFIGMVTLTDACEAVFGELKDPLD